MLQSDQSQTNVSQPMVAASVHVNASVPTERTDDHFVERHATILKRIAAGPVGLVFLGDSITRRWLDNPDLWERYFAQYHPANLGVGGDGTQHVLWRIQHGELDHMQPRVIVLLIGTNNAPTNTGPEIAAAIRQIITIIRAKLPDAKILLLAIFPRGPQRPEYADAQNPYYMDVIHSANRELVACDDGKTIRFLDIGSLFLNAAGEIETAVMPDLLHLIAPGYVMWAEASKTWSPR